MQKYLMALLIFMAGTGTLASQKFLSAESIGSFTAFQLSLLAGFPVDNGVEQIRVLYEMPGINGEMDTVSGLIVLPVISSQEDLPLLVYQHPTSTNGRDDVPSSGGFSIGSIESIVYGAFGYMVFASDYLGLGTSRGFHPFIHAETEAAAGLNIIYAGLEYIENQEGVSWDSTHLFVAGYSQGGHASMALHRELEANHQDIFPVTAAAHMSGPYSISGVMLEKFLRDEPSGNVADLVYVLLGYQSAYQTVFDSVSQVFRAPYDSTIQNFFDDPYALGVFEGELQLQLMQNEGASIARNLLQPDFLEKLEDPSSNISALIRENDTYNWAPAAPTRLYYCQMDERVPFQNAILADSVMRDLGSLDMQAINVNGTVDHVDCTLFALFESIDFFDEAMMTVSTIREDSRGEQASIMPNPTDGWIRVEGESASFHIEVFNTSGQGLWRGRVQSSQLVDLSFLPDGYYMARIHTDQSVITRPFIINRS